MKIGKEAKLKIKENEQWELQALVDCGASVKGKERYSGIYSCPEIGFLFSTDGFRIFATSLKGNFPRGKFVVKDFAESLACNEIPESTPWFPDFRQMLPTTDPAEIIKLTVPGMISAVDNKKKSGHMTMNFENDGVFLYLGEVPNQRLSPKHIHFNLAFWSHLGGQTVKIKYYNNASPVLVLPEDADSNNVFTEKWFSLIMPTKDSGDPLFSRTEG